jgi:hypothetical protein
VEPRAAQRRQAVVERRAHDRVDERVAAHPLGVLAQHARGDRLLQRRHQLVTAERPDLLEHVEVELAADDGGRGERVPAGIAEPGEAPPGDLAHAVGHAGLEQRDGAAEVPVGIGEMAHDLLDEEGVAVGLAVQLLDERRRPRTAAERAHERAGLGGVEACDVEPVERPLAAQAGEQRLERLAALVGPGGGEEERGLGGGRAHEVGDELERRLVGPVQVVEDDEQRRRAGDLGEQRRDGVEEAEPLGAELPHVQRARGAVRRRAELRQHDAQLTGARAEPAGERGERGAARPAAQHLHDRLIGRDPLLVEAPVEDDRAVAVRVVGELGGEPRLSDARVPGEHDEPAGAARAAAPRVVEARRLGRAADESMPAADAVERGRPAAGGDGRRRARRRERALRWPSVQEPFVHGHRFGPRRGPQLVAEEPAQLLERPQRLSRVAGRLVRLHQQAVRGLAERRHRDRRPRGLDRLAELAAAQRRVGEHLAGADPQAVHGAALLVQPRAVAVGEELARKRAEHVARGGTGRLPVPVLPRRLGAPRGGRAVLHVDPDAVVERDA